MLVAGVVAFPAFAGEVAPFLTLTATVGTDGGAASEFATGSHDAVLVRALNEGNGSVELGSYRWVDHRYEQFSLDPYPRGTLYAQDAMWLVDVESLYAYIPRPFVVGDGNGVRWGASDGSPGQVTVFELFDVPVAPAAFSGVNTAPSYSTVAFTVPDTGRYLADLTLTQGTVTVTTGTLSKTFASSGQMSLGTLTPSPNGDPRPIFVTVAAKDGPQAHWQLAVHAAPAPPVTVTVTLDQSRSTPGSLVTVSYTLPVAATVTAAVLAADGSVVRGLANQLRAVRGPHTLTFDGLDTSGKPLPAGTYTIRLDITDASGTTASSSASLEIAATPLQVTLPPAITLGPTDPITATLTDPAASVTQITVQVDGKTTASPVGSPTLAFRPRAGWTPGKHTIVFLLHTKNGTTTRIARTVAVTIRAGTTRKA